MALIIVGLFMIFTGFQSDAGTASFTNLWSHGGFFPNEFMGFVAGFQIAVFAFVGIELVGTAAAETKNPEQNLPKAINAIPMRVLLFYVGALIILMSVTPWTEFEAGHSPFIAMFSLAGLGMAATVVNLVVLTSAMSSANSGIYSTSRMVYGLAQDGDAPKLFGRLSSRKVPQNALFLSCVLLLSGVVLLYAGKDVGEAFDMVTTVSAVCFMFVWSHHPGQLPRVPQAPPAPARGLDVQDARRHPHGVGGLRVLRVRPLGPDHPAGHPRSPAGDPHLVPRPGRRLGHPPPPARPPCPLRGLPGRAARRRTSGGRRAGPRKVRPGGSIQGLPLLGFFANPGHQVADKRISS